MSKYSAGDAPLPDGSNGPVEIQAESPREPGREALDRLISDVVSSARRVGRLEAHGGSTHADDDLVGTINAIRAALAAGGAAAETPAATEDRWDAYHVQLASDALRENRILRALDREGLADDLAAIAARFRASTALWLNGPAQTPSRSTLRRIASQQGEEVPEFEAAQVCRDCGLHEVDPIHDDGEGRHNFAPRLSAAQTPRGEQKVEFIDVDSLPIDTDYRHSARPVAIPEAPTASEVELGEAEDTVRGWFGDNDAPDYVQDAFDSIVRASEPPTVPTAGEGLDAKQLESIQRRAAAAYENPYADHDRSEGVSADVYEVLGHDVADLIEEVTRLRALLEQPK